MDIEVVRDPSEKTVETWRVRVGDRFTSPRWAQRGPADAYADALRAGTRRPEFTSVSAGGGTLIENPDRERIMLTTWRSALRLEQIGIQVARGRKVSSIAKAYLGIKHAITIPELKDRITARLTEMGYPESDRAGRY
jgi:hypothetical protein